MTTPLDVHSLAGPYSLNALDDLERDLFEEHIIACEPCAVEVAELRETAAMLAQDSWAVPPPRLKSAVMAQITGTRQSLPSMRPPTRRTPALRWRHSSRSLVAAGVAAIVAAAGVYVVQELRLRDQRIVAQAETARIESLLTAADANLRSVNVDGGGRLTVVTSVDRDEAVVVLTEASDPGAGKAYQLWLIQGSTPKSAGLLAPDQVNATRVITGVSGTNILALTVEPAAGSLVPTTPVKAQLPLTG
jgi:hypothetical protein